MLPLVRRFRWYRKFVNGDEVIEELRRIERRPMQKKQLVIDNCDAVLDPTVLEIAAITCSTRCIIHDIFSTSGRIANLSQVLPQSLIDKKRVDVSTSLPSHHRALAWTASTVTVDEMCCIYDNTVRHKHRVDSGVLPKPHRSIPIRSKTSVVRSFGT